MLGNPFEEGVQKVDKYWPSLNLSPLRLKCLNVITTYEGYVPNTNGTIVYRQFNLVSHV